MPVTEEVPNVIEMQAANVDDESLATMPNVIEMQAANVDDESLAKLVAELASTFPTTTKRLVKNNTILRLPASFCKENMPIDNCFVTLEDVNGQTFQIKYLANTGSFSAGLSKFIREHNLKEGDVIVLQLVEQQEGIKFKVYILNKPESQSEEQVPNKDTNTLPDEVIEKYNLLCQSQDVILHKDTVLDGIGEGGIGEDVFASTINTIVRISEAIKSCPINTSEDEFTEWDGWLKGFEGMGVRVGFLRDRIKKLMTICHSIPGGSEQKLKEYEDIMKRKKTTDAEIRDLEQKLALLKEDCATVEARIKELETEAEKSDAQIETLKPAESWIREFEEAQSAPFLALSDIPTS